MVKWLKDWINSDLGVGGEYQYKAIHLISVAVIMAVILICGFIAASKKVSDKQKRAMLVTVCVFQLAFEVTWRMLYLFVKKEHIKMWYPMYPCNLAGILIPIIALLDWKKGKQIFYMFGFIGGVLTFAMPSGIYTRNVLTFPILKSIIQHTGLLIIPVIEHASKKYRSSVGDYGWIFIGLLIHLVNCEVIDPAIGFVGDYMFLRSGLPFVIPGVPKWIPMAVSALLVIFLMCYASDVKTSNMQFKSLSQKFKNNKSCTHNKSTAN